jgi:MFS family permease
VSLLESFFGLADAKPEVRRIAAIFTILGVLMQATIMISTTFYLIFVAEALGNGDFYLGMASVGFLVVIQMAIQTLLDYPTGVVGDWIGQRYILATAFLTYAAVYYLVSLVTYDSPFLFIALIYALQGVGGSQQSGAMGSWLDNNWRVAMAEDEGRRQYGVFIGKYGMVMWFTNVLILIPGGILAVTIARQWVFQLQAVLCVVIALAVLRLVKDLPGVKETTEEKPSTKEYFSLLRGGITYLFSGPYVTYLLLGSMLVTSSIAVWGNLILFPIYYGYLETDTAVAALRTLVMIPLVVYSERSGVWAKRFVPEKWIPRFRFIQTAGAVFFWIVAAIYFIFPPPPEGSPMISFMIPGTDILILQAPIASLVPVLMLVILFYVCGAFLQVAGVLTSRIFVDAIPNRVRNGVYSLFPTVVMLFGIPQIIFFGMFIPFAGIPATLILCGCVSTLGVLMIRHGLSYPPPAEFESPDIEQQ